MTLCQVARQVAPPPGDGVGRDRLSQPARQAQLPGDVQSWTGQISFGIARSGAAY